MAEKVLITGATGLIGHELVRLCKENNLPVHYLTTQKEKIVSEPGFKGFYWNPAEGIIDPEAFEDVTIIVHLAGAPIAGRWTEKYKKTIIDSRVQSANLLYETLKELNHNIGYFISASGINIYPDSQTKLYTEEDVVVADTFLGEVVEAWENAAAQFKNLGMDVAKVRTGMVLDKNKGALPKLVQPVKLGAGAPLGSGDQWQSWIHIEDITGIYFFLLTHKLEGIYNAVASNPVQNKRMIELIASQLRKPLWMPKVPAFLLKLILGEMAILVLEGQLVSSNKIKKLGYQFRFYNAESALQDLLT